MVNQSIFSPERQIQEFSYGGNQGLTNFFDHSGNNGIQYSPPNKQQSGSFDDHMLPQAPQAYNAGYNNFNCHHQNQSNMQYSQPQSFVGV